MSDQSRLLVRGQLSSHGLTWLGLETPGASVIRALSLPLRACPHDLVTSPKAPDPGTMVLGVRFQHVNLKET